MVKLKYAGRIILLLAIMCIVAAGCGHNGHKPDIQAITIALPQEPVKLDPYHSENKAEKQVFQSIFNKLVGMDSQGNLIPELADKWIISPDGKLYTFYLHRNIKFHDGTPFNAEAVRFNLERYREQQSQRSYELQAVESIKVLDEYTVQVLLKQPYTPLLYVLADKAGMMCSPAAVRRQGIQFMNAPVGTGPYIFNTRVRGSSVTLNANPQYWREQQPAADTLTYKIIPNEKTALANLRSGILDLNKTFPLEEIKHYQQHERLAVYSQAGVDFTGISLNVAQKPLQDVRVRQAIELLLNRDKLSSEALHGAAAAGRIPLVAFGTGYDRVLDMPMTDVKQARALLAVAGYADGFELKLEIDMQPSSALTAQYIQQMLRAGNINLVIEKQDITALLRRMQRGDFQAALLDVEGYLEPDRVLYDYFHTSGRFNYMNYSNEQVDAWLEQARSLPQSRERAELYEAIAAQLLEDSPFIFLYHKHNVQAMSNRLQGVQVLPDGIVETALLHK